MRHVGTRPIETERLLLRRVKEGDAEEAFRNWTSDPEVTRFLRWEPHRDAGETRRVFHGWAENYAAPRFYLWMIERREDGALLGTIGVFAGEEEDAPEGWQPAYCIGRTFWNRGYTTEALKGVMAYFLEGTGADTLTCCHAMENPASGRVLRHCGFFYTHDGAYHRFDGSEVPAHYYRFEKGGSC